MDKTLTTECQVYLVGGAVRDQLLGLPVHDKDFVVVGANPQMLLALEFRQVGVDFPVFLHPQSGNEYALARLERKNGTGYQGFATDTKGVSLADDLFRRDLTINALAMEVNGLFDDTLTTGKIIDFYGGIADLKNKTLRHISSAFCEDPLRVLRCVRFFAKYNPMGFNVHPSTLVLMQQMSEQGLLAELSRERIWAESVKAMTIGAGAAYWSALYDLGILPYVLPKLDEAWQDKKRRFDAINSLKFAANHSVAVQFALLFVRTTQEVLQDSAKRLSAPKYAIKLAQLLLSYPSLPATACGFLQLIEQTHAHKDFLVLSELLNAMDAYACAVGSCLNGGHQNTKELLGRLVSVYKAIGIKDIDPNLQGRHIYEALTQKRLQAITQVLPVLLSKL